MTLNKRLTVLISLAVIAITGWTIALTTPQAVAERQARIEYKILEVYKPPVYVTLPAPSPVVDAKDLGEFTVTYYTAGKESTGKSKGHPAYGITRSGATVAEGVTVAVDPKIIPLGTYLYIEGIGFRVAQDIGGAIKGKAIDVYVPDVKEARKLGRHPAKVYIIGGN